MHVCVRAGVFVGVRGRGCKCVCVCVCVCVCGNSKSIDQGVPKHTRARTVTLTRARTLAHTGFGGPEGTVGEGHIVWCPVGPGERAGQQSH